MSEFIVIQVGQCGNQIGSLFLPQILEEYDIKPTTINSKTTKNNKNISSFFNLNNGISSFESINDLIKNNAKARFLCIDMEDSVVARIKTGKYRDLYDKKCLITNYPGSGNNWAEGHCDHGPKYEAKILKAVQYLVEQCDSLHGFLFLFSVGGGTGSGLGTFLVKLLTDHYPHIERFVTCVYPTGTEDVVTCPYNMAFSTQVLLENATCVFPSENLSLMEIVRKQSTNRYSNEKFDKLPSTFTPFEDMNRIIVEMMLHLTSGSRFPGAMNIDMNEINTNMIPFPKLNYLTSGFSPFSSFRSFQARSSSQQLKNETFLSACHRNNQLIKIDPFDAKHISLSCTLLARGNYFLNDIRTYIDKLEAKLKFPPWSKKAVKVGLCNVPPKGCDYAMFTLFNSTSMLNLFEKILMQFSKLYDRKAHVYHYTNITGFELDNFEECRASLGEIIELYNEIENLRPISSSHFPDFNIN